MLKFLTTIPSIDNPSSYNTFNASYRIHINETSKPSSSTVLSNFSLQNVPGFLVWNSTHQCDRPF